MKEENKEKEKLFTKKDYWNIFMYVWIMFASVCSGVTVYIFFVYGYIKLFTDYSFFSVMNVGGLMLCFFVTFNMFKFLKKLWNDWRSLFHWTFHQSVSFVFASKRKVKEPIEPEKDWINKE